MSNNLQSRESLKAVFQDGRKPNGSNFDDWITTMATQSGENTFSNDPQVFNGPIILNNVPDSPVGLSVGQLWHNNGVLCVVVGSPTTSTTTPIPTTSTTTTPT